MKAIYILEYGFEFTCIKLESYCAVEPIPIWLAKFKDKFFFDHHIYKEICGVTFNKIHIPENYPIRISTESVLNYIIKCLWNFKKKRKDQKGSYRKY